MVNIHTNVINNYFNFICYFEQSTVNGDSDRMEVDENVTNNEDDDENIEVEDDPSNNDDENSRDQGNENDDRGNESEEIVENESDCD